ncbi:putative major intrinsic protein [Helianthus annuus]|nr:putative major intrinsic protein [Helianthus annuus]KAJ0455794.1 putative major intrinsic protein [Helianthus annuus]KAJ0462760.1 putative major intrinsic protein [Helianthus annuus]KAJ0484091.1 putative major intrinsic protein [Helianthus annuus]KAJ0652598.1 putative major intrinsic protein [Helianthus annuus]
MIEVADPRFSAMEKGTHALSESKNPKIHLAQKFLGEFVGTFCVIFVGCGSVAVNKLYGGTITFMGVCNMGLDRYGHDIRRWSYKEAWRDCSWDDHYVKCVCGRTYSRASMNPTRSLGPAIVKWRFKGIWAYIIGSIIGAVTRGFVYKLLTSTEKSFSEIVKRSG